ncbi:MAG: heat-inducible transcriptional repressor HrcA [Chlamydiae bacterium]|nr:heat-inducible transcriptional repressor HrcA [Chlamydiota bacterium]
MPELRKGKEDREFKVLLGLVKLYLETGKPIGSNTLKESAFDRLSSATIRNYFARLEKEGFLMQHHSSGGRVPTEEAYKIFAKEALLNNSHIEPDEEFALKEVLCKETRELSIYFQEAIEKLSDILGSAVFFSSPRFDQDFIVEVKLVPIDDKRCLCVIVTDFSLVHTVILYTEQKMSLFSLKRVEQYFHFRLTGLDKPVLSSEEESFAKKSYNEVVLRHFVMYTNFNQEDVYKAGFSKLLSQPEFYDPLTLASSLAIFENSRLISPLLQETIESGSIKYWIGSDLERITPPPHVSSIIATSYSINHRPVGAIAILGASRQQYEKVFGVLKLFSELLSETLTKSMYKYKLSYRQPGQFIDNKAVSMIENQESL